MKQAFAIKASPVVTFVFYKCEGDFCGHKYAVEEKATEEPCCPVCGSYYFSHLTDKRIKFSQGR